jgi:hypothetical protein
MNILIKSDNYFLSNVYFLSHIKGNPLNKCGMLKFFISVQDNYSYYFSHLAKNVAH